MDTRAKLSVVVVCILAAAQTWADMKVFDFPKPTKVPIVFSAESKAEKASAGDYGLWLDIHYADGSATWGSGDAYAPCRGGTHGWEKTTGVFRPSLPVTKIEFSTLFRHGTKGKVLFRNGQAESDPQVSGRMRECRKDPFCDLRYGK